MMELLMPLGLLGLLGIAIIILIYILKPNYQQKVVSSTYVWKLSLRYRKKQIPISRLLSLLILLCQILVVTACALILAQPFIMGNEPRRDNEQIIVIDGSANMLAARNGLTRFERAVEQARELASNTLMQADGMVTVILADDDADVLVQRAGQDRREEALDAIDSLINGDTLKCSYGQADVEGAMDYATQTLSENPYAHVLYYTATEYVDAGEVEVVNVAQEGEWNAAILDVEVSLEENFYSFTVDLASYGRASTVNLVCEIYGANNDFSTIELVYPNISCNPGEEQTVTIATGVNAYPVNCPTPVFAYDYVNIRVDVAEQDSFVYDDSITLYGGRPETIDIQYASSAMNPFVSNALMALRDSMRLRWDVNIREVRVTGSSSPAATPEMVGYDLYIFEHTMPTTLPTDGVVFLINPRSVPDGADIVLDSVRPNESEISIDQQDHPILQGIHPEYLYVSAYTSVPLYDRYETLLSVGDDPLLLLRNEPTSKIVIFPFSLNYSTLPLVDLPYFIYNIFNYFLPTTITDASGDVGFLFDVGETVVLNARGESLTVSIPDENRTEQTFTEFPENLTVALPGEYRTSQVLISGGGAVSSSFFVKVAASESDVTRTYDELYNPKFPELPPDADLDLLLYLAIALAALLFIEWLLQARENM